MKNMIGKSIGNYTLQSSLGEGGMAEVFLAKNNLGKRFTVKILKPELFGKAAIKQRFVNEAQMMLSLEHTHIRQVIDFYEDSTLMAIVMEYLEGQDLGTYIETHGQVAERQATDWFRQILPAFSYTHEQDIVHRDVKPSNIFLTKNGTLKVLDFGIAKIIDSNLSLTGTQSIMGTPMYMSPEQIQIPKEVDYRTDIYSLGVMLYVLLTGKQPYDDSTESEYWIQTQIVNQPLPSVAHISPHLNTVIAKATAKNRQERYQSCEQFLRDLTPESKASASAPPKPTPLENTPSQAKAFAKPAPTPHPHAIKTADSSPKRSTPWGKYLAFLFGTILLVIAALMVVGYYYGDKEDELEVKETILNTPCKLVRVSFSDGNYLKYQYNNDGTLHMLTSLVVNQNQQTTTTVTVAYNNDGLASRYTYTYNAQANGYAEFFYQNGAISAAEFYDSAGKLYQKMEFQTDSFRRIVRQKNVSGTQAGAYFNYYYDDRGNVTKWEQVDAKDKTMTYALYSNYDDQLNESNSVKKGLPFNPADGLPFSINNYQTARYYEADANGVLQMKEESVLTDFQYNNDGFVVSNHYDNKIARVKGTAKSTYENCQ
jgi:serine/threonine protein kinase